MANIQKALDALQPYVIGIRYLEGTVLVDVVFKEGWIVPDDKLIKKEKGNDTMNYYMLFSESPNIGLDEILGYVENTIKLNLEKEKKYDLLKAKVDELKELFKKNTLAKLKNLRFTFDEVLVPDMNEFNLDIDEEFPSGGLEPVAYEEEVIQPQTPVIPQGPEVYLDENHNPIPMTEEDREILAEEARAERNRLAIKNKKANPQKKIINVELPPRKQKEVYVPEPSGGGYCTCGPNDACNICMDSKDY
jgi:hypothetical protein